MPAVTADTRTNRLPKNPEPGNLPNSVPTRPADRSPEDGPWLRPRRSCRGEDDGPIVRHRDRVLEMGGQRMVGRHDRPAVGECLHVSVAEREHRLDGDADTGP